MGARIHLARRCHRKGAKTNCYRPGPLTREKLMEQGYSDEIAVGDPAILVPLLYEPNSKPSGDIAVIPQHRDAQAPIFRMIAEMEGFRLIDICTDIEDFCDQLTGCRGVVSSSLHAVVAAHGYKILASPKNRYQPLG